MKKNLCKVYFKKTEQGQTNNLVLNNTYLPPFV